MYNFNYHRPLSIEEAVSLAGGAPEGRLLAGGQTLIPTLKQRLANPSDLIDLNGIAELKQLSTEGDGGSLVVGAMCSHASVAASDMVRSAIPALAKLADGIGDAQVRNQGTLGGSIANNDPAADYPAALLGLGASVRTDHREIAADDFFTGMFETALEPAEMIRDVVFPVPSKAGYAKFANPASRYAIVGVFVSQGAGGVRVAVTGAGSSVFRVPAMEQALAGNFSAGALDGVSVDAGALNADLHASAEYRAHLVTVMAKRAVEAAG